MSKPISTFEKVIAVMNVILTILMLFVTGLLVYWASKHWDVMDGQLKAMVKSIELAKESNEVTKGLSDATIKYAREQTEAAKRSADAAKRTVELTEKTLKTHIDPQISCFLEEHPEKKGFLLFTVKNSGEIDVSKLSVHHRYFRYDKDARRLVLSVTTGEIHNKPGMRWIYLPNLLVNKSVAKLAGESARAPDSMKKVDCLLFDVEYYRESDGKQYTKRCDYYIEGADIFTNKEFQRSEHYQIIQAQLPEFIKHMDMPLPGIDKRQ